MHIACYYSFINATGFNILGYICWKYSSHFASEGFLPKVYKKVKKYY